MFATLHPLWQTHRILPFHPEQTMICPLALIVSWCKMTAILKLVTNYICFHQTTCPPLFISTGLQTTPPDVSKFNRTDEFICMPVHINAHVWWKLMWNLACVRVHVCHTPGPGSQASWIHLSAAAPPEDLWALQWKSLAAPHSGRKKTEDGKEERRTGGGGNEMFEIKVLSEHFVQN